MTQQPDDEPTRESNPVKPGLARVRLPFEADEAIRRQRGRSGTALIYATGAILLGALAGYMALIERLPLTDPKVLAPAVGAIWFAVRTAMLAGRGRSG